VLLDVRVTRIRACECWCRWHVSRVSWCSEVCVLLCVCVCGVHSCRQMQTTLIQCSATNVWILPCNWLQGLMRLRSMSKCWLCLGSHMACKLFDILFRLVKWFCIWCSWCHCHPIISCSSKIQIGFTFLVPAYPGCPGKEAVKQMLCLSVSDVVYWTGGDLKVICNDFLVVKVNCWSHALI